jgi:hypothetical protein
MFESSDILLSASFLDDRQQQTIIRTTMMSITTTKTLPPMIICRLNFCHKEFLPAFNASTTLCSNAESSESNTE